MINILIELIYVGWATEILRKGNFPVNKKKFNDNPDRAVAEVALNWIRQIRLEQQISEIIRVKYNGTNDITELVKHS